ncbi:MAG: hypothetical protein HYY18_00335 [Planctomycetes bacterium]|nr:hypothetical protein [Planctomycetota bacterium]
MLKGRRFWTFAMVIALCVIVTAGCRRKRSGSTTITGSDIFTTDSFPGGDVQDNNVADDKRAMSMSGQDFVGGSLKVTMNGDRGTGMATYTTTNGFGGSSDGGLYAHYFDGATFTPPVNLRAIDSVGVFPTTTADIIHAFINTEEHVSDDAQARDGDCVIIWRNTDFASGGTDGANIGAFCTYFDVSFAEDVSRNFGFQEFASRFDAQDGAGENVSTIAVVTDGLCGEARWLSGSNSYSYGDQTTDIELIFRQIEDSAAAGANDDQVLFAARMQLDAAIAEDIPLVPTGLVRLGVVGFGASDGGTDAEETQVDQVLLTYNDLLVFRVFSDADFAAGPSTSFTPFDGATAFAGSDTTLQYIDFTLGTGAVGAATSLHAVAVDSLAGEVDENNADFLRQNGSYLTRRSCYGEDEGLAIKVLYFTQYVEDATAVFWTNELNNARLTIAEIDGAGVFLEDAFISVDDVDEDDNVLPTVVDTQISRNGDYIWAAWLARVDITVGVDTDGGTLGLWCNQYITTRPDDDGLFVVPALADTLSGTFNPGVPTVTEPVVLWFGFQGALGYVCGAQSDADVMALFFEQSDGTFDEVDQVVLDADVVPVGVTPVVTTFLWEVFESGDQSYASTVRMNMDLSTNFVAADSGEGGNHFTTYLDDVDGTAIDDFRIFAEKDGIGAGVAEIDSAVTFRNAGAFQTLRLVSTPAGSDIGTFNVVDLEDDDNRYHGSENIHVFFFETRSAENVGAGLALRTRQFRTEDDGVAFGDNFVPNAGTGFEDPFTFDLPGIDPTETPTVNGVAREGNSVGVWFFYMLRLYYQEFGNGNNDDEVGWLHEGEDGFEVSNPFLIDDESEVSIDSVALFTTKSCTCETLEGAIIFWTIEHDDGSETRLRARVRGGND